MIPDTIRKESITNAAALLRVLADFSKKASSVFMKLHKSTVALDQRIVKLSEARYQAQIHFNQRKSASCNVDSVVASTISRADILNDSHQSGLKSHDAEVVVYWGIKLSELCNPEPEFHLVDQWKTSDGGSYSKFYSDPEYFVDQWVKEQIKGFQREMEQKRTRKTLNKDRRARREAEETRRRAGRSQQVLETKKYSQPDDFSHFTRGVLPPAESPRAAQLYDVPAAAREAWLDLLVDARPYAPAPH
eukprot:CAMPEP_0172183628 /NCGR_PEP_ID=MMETSP1050-20130122/19099_1 /TAXON_ID=233186 /ORGANISM="Cryptomonas curvata, Strain CCAP979/52" /LENGTH=246 /DNA_ID=CAMNT_0012857283 /DNA_START=5 /DNA_END=742 /DNA_ORIENTATION=-